jgi:hypothetical protein
MKNEKFTKTTVLLPKTLLKEAQLVTKTGITQTICIALEMLASKKAFEKMLALENTYKSSLDLKNLRQ